jgi:hypothetical protein
MIYLKIPTLSDKDIQRYWRLVDRRGVDDCWHWRGAKSDEGYGRFKLARRLFSATRIGYYIAFKVDPAPKHVCHTCDNPKCCNPKHFWRGTSGENNDDSVRKGRYHRKDTAVKGERVVGARYTARQVKRLRHLAQTMTVAKAAQLTGVNISSAYHIVSGAGWQHLKVLARVKRTRKRN